MTYTPSKLLSFEEFIARIWDNTRYELIDGELRDIEPTGLTKRWQVVLLV
jgi:Uma2 family endonuclease